jgi:hypothetical protein
LVPGGEDAAVSLLPSLIVLGLAAVVSWRLTLGRAPILGQPQEARSAGWALALATGIQSLHFLEEASTGFPQRLGELVGLPPMPNSFFLVFNLAWIGIWIVSVPGLRSGRPAAYFPAWFLAVAAVVNGFAHPMLALVSAGYFPGLVTSPFIGIAGYRLWRRLQTATQPKAGRQAVNEPEL